MDWTGHDSWMDDDDAGEEYLDCRQDHCHGTVYVGWRTDERGKLQTWGGTCDVCGCDVDDDSDSDRADALADFSRYEDWLDDGTDVPF